MAADEAVAVALTSAMIAFGSPIDDPEAYRRYAEPGVLRAAESDSALYPLAAVDSPCRTYNLLLDLAAQREDLEALVLVHPRVELTDPELCTKLREVLRDPEVAIAGAAGATGVRSIAWWEGAVSAAPLVHSYHEHGGGELIAFSWARPDAALGEVETVDGHLLVLSPWATRNLRFDESLVLGHGYDLDLCLRARAAGKKVVAADLRATYHRPLELIENLELWTQAHIQLAEKWDGRLRERVSDEAGWERRARRAEAEREAARAFAFSTALRLEASVRELERELARKTGTVGWRLTAPLRRANHARRGVLARVRRRQG